MLAAANAHYRRQAQLAAAAAAQARRAWDQTTSPASTKSWNAFTLARTVATLQLLAAQPAEPYVSAALAEQGIDPAALGTLNVMAFAAVAGDGRSLLTLLDYPRIAAQEAVRAGVGAAVAWSRARDELALMTRTAVQDAGRAAVSVATVAQQHVQGFVRMLNPPSCDRCAVLAGAWYRWNAGFLRHPGCDCIGVPAQENTSGDLRTNPREAIVAGQVTGLSKADYRAIVEHGADVGQVINAHRGMYTAAAYGRQLKATHEGVTRRGVAGKRLEAAGVKFAKTSGRYGRAQIPRLRPESIYAAAGGNRDEAVRLLKRFGYLT